jgi:hypothetical protein
VCPRPAERDTLNRLYRTHSLPSADPPRAPENKAILPSFARDTESLSLYKAPCKSQIPSPSLSLSLSLTLFGQELALRCPESKSKLIVAHSYDHCVSSWRAVFPRTFHEIRARESRDKYAAVRRWLALQEKPQTI